MTPDQTLHENSRWTAAQPRLSVLIPSYRDDPRPLLTALAGEARGPSRTIEAIVLDDGGGDEGLAAGIADLLADLPFPARFVRRPSNEGRARARNCLARHARAAHFLFLDSDTLPDQPDFLVRWLDTAAREAPPVACGGFKVDRAAARSGTDLHRAVASRSDCLPAAVRRLSPTKYVFTNNLLVRRDVWEAEPFDEGFVGWGWEDVEWGVRVGRRWPILHLDNPVQNDRLDTVDGLMRKYRQAAPNFARMLAAHPEVTATFPAFRAARVLKRTRLRRPLGRVMEGVARHDRAPMRVRELALKTYRAALYAEVI